MARKKGNKPALTGAERVKLHRQRKKLLLNQNQRANEYLQQLDVNSTSQIETQNTSKNARVRIQKWASEYRVSKRALNALLPILQSNGLSVPRNFRTLQETPRKIELVNVAGGQLWHNGLVNCLKNIFPILLHDLTLHLKFNIDGLPLYNSSNKSFWPILASISGM